MIGLKTIFNITDNSGGIKGECIKVLNSRSQNAFIGKFIIVSIKKTKFRKKMKVKSHDIHLGIIVRTKKKINRFNGLILNFDNNSIVLLDKNKNPLFNRIYGPISYEIREKKLMKLILMAPSIF